MLYEKLLHYANTEAYPMHMPGHKRNMRILSSDFPYNQDITEIHGFDDLSDPQGILKETADLAARLYGSKKAFLLINGSTVGILAAIGAHTKRGDKILYPKSSHRSVHNATGLFGLKAVHYAPKIDNTTNVECSTEPEMINVALDQNPETKLIVVTSPSYEGVISDISSIADIAHNQNIPLLVDSAHGAHLGFSDFFEESAVKSGADIVVTSLHKTLPALTQCSLLHICSDKANTTETARLLNILQTSSPSYLLMASIDHCLRLLDSDSNKLFDSYEQKLTRFYQKTSKLKKLKVIGSQEHGFQNPANSGFFAYDPGKIVIVTKNTTLSGAELMNILRNSYNIELEAAHPNYAIAMTSICDTAEGLTRLATALNEIDERL